MMRSTEEARDLAEEVEMYLRAWRPGSELERRPRQRGMSGHVYTFDFLQGNELIDVVPPHHNATGGVMRKLGDILNAQDDPSRKVRVIVDDRTDPLRADVELQILASLATAMPLTKLMSKIRPGTA